MGRRWWGQAQRQNLNQPLKSMAAVDAQAALPVVGIGSADGEARRAAYSRMLSRRFFVEDC
jgi:hypothetical protein